MLLKKKKRKKKRLVWPIFRNAKVTTSQIIERKLDNKVLYLIFFFAKSNFLMNKILKTLKEEMYKHCILSFLKYCVIKCLRIKDNSDFLLSRTVDRRVLCIES